MSSKPKTNTSHPTYFVQHAVRKTMDADTKALIRERDQHLSIELRNPASQYWRTAYPQLKTWATREIAKFRDISVDDRDDLVVRSIARFWRYLPKFRGECMLYTYFCMIVKSECLSFLKRQKKTEALFDRRADACELIEKIESTVCNYRTAYFD